MMFGDYLLDVLEVSGRDPLTSFTVGKTQIGSREENSSSNLANRSITVRAFIEADEYNELTKKRDHIILELYAGMQRRNLSFDDENKYYIATFIKFETIKESERFCEFKLYFDCYPHAYDKDIQTIESNEIINEGSCSADCTIQFELENTISEFTISIKNSDSKVVLNNSNGLGGKWLIDTEKRKVYKDASLSRCLDFENTVWKNFKLNTGKTTFITSVDVALSISFRKEYH